MTYDSVNIWSEIKLDIVRNYASAYSQILSTRRTPSFTHVYIDAFAGPGMHFAKSSSEFIAGSPLNALNVKPPFKQYHFIDLNSDKVESLKSLVGGRKDVVIYEGDCNVILLEKVFPQVKYSAYRRGLCLLDPYGLHLNWNVIHTAGQMQSLEVFINFPIMDMNRNVLHRQGTASVGEKQIARMNAYWGDESWRDAAYNTQGNLFGFEDKIDNESLVQAFGKRLKEIAGFEYVPRPLPMRNSIGATVYYLFFAAHKPVAEHIVQDIFDRYRNRGALSNGN